MLAIALFQPVGTLADQRLPKSRRSRSNFTDSVRASILTYPIENGRRYHAFRSGSESTLAFYLVVAAILITSSLCYAQ